MKKLLMGAALLLGTAASAQGLLDQRRGRDLPLPALPEVVQRVQQAPPGRAVQLPVDRLRRRHQADHRAHRRLRRHRRADDRRASSPRRRTCVHIPTVLGAVVVTYNVPGVDEPQASRGETLADIFLGKITKWNDPRDRGRQPGRRSCPTRRSSSCTARTAAGTTSIFTDYLAQGQPGVEEQGRRGRQREVAGRLGGKGNEGVAGQVKSTPGAIGYVELAYASRTSCRRRAQERRPATSWSRRSRATTAAAARRRDAGRLPRLDHQRAGQGRLPDRRLHLAPRLQGSAKDAAKGKALVEFLWWAIHDGQKHRRPARLRAAAARGGQEQVLKTIDTLTVNGAKVGAKSRQPMSRGCAADSRSMPPRTVARAAGTAGDRVFDGVLSTLGGMVLVVAGLIVLDARAGWRGPLAPGARPLGLRHRHRVGSGRRSTFGALPFIYGTLVSSLLALLIAVPLVARRWRSSSPSWRRPGSRRAAGVPGRAAGRDPERRLRPLGDLRARALAARVGASRRSGSTLGFLPLFQGPPLRLRHARRGAHPGDHDPADHRLGVARGAARRPAAQREAALALGATRWETIRIAVLPYGRSGHRRRHHPRPRPRARRDDGGDDGDRQPPRDLALAVRARLHDGERDRQRVRRGDRRPVPRRRSPRSACSCSSSPCSSTRWRALLVWRGRSAARAGRRSMNLDSAAAPAVVDRGDAR